MVVVAVVVEVPSFVLLLAAVLEGAVAPPSVAAARVVFVSLVFINNTATAPAPTALTAAAAAAGAEVLATLPRLVRLATLFLRPCAYPQQDQKAREAGGDAATDDARQGEAAAAAPPPDRPNETGPRSSGAASTPGAAAAAAAAAGGAGGGGRGVEYGFGEEGTDMDRTIFRTLEMLSKVQEHVPRACVLFYSCCRREGG